MLQFSVILVSVVLGNGMADDPRHVFLWTLWQAIDHIINSAAKTYYMSGGQISVPIVFRGPNGAAAGVGAQHSQASFLSPVSLFSSWINVYFMSEAKCYYSFNA